MGQLGALPDFRGDKLWLSRCLERAGDSGLGVTLSVLVGSDREAFVQRQLCGDL